MTNETCFPGSRHDERPSGAVSLVELLIWVFLIGSITAAFLLAQIRVSVRGKVNVSTTVEAPSMLDCGGDHFSILRRPDDGSLAGQLCAYRAGQSLVQRHGDPQANWQKPQFFISLERP